MRVPADVIHTVATWAAGQADVRAVALVGSHARGSATVDSDIDLVLVVDEVDRRLGARSWLADFGQVRDVEHEDWGLVQSLRVYYGDGPEVEFGLAPVDWATPPLDDGTRTVIQAGSIVLFDPHGLLFEMKQAATAIGDKEGRDGRTTL